MILSCPAKTFLLGEYVALDGGPSILLATAPRFQLKVSRSGSRSGSGLDSEPSQHEHEHEHEHERQTFPWHSDSPVGKLAARNAEELSPWTFEFNDPYSGRGGLGASSAQFVLLYSFLNDWTLPTDLTAMLLEYRECAWDGTGTPPSGADVVAQIRGGVTWFDGRDVSAARMTWPFEDLSFTLIRTGVKLATHEHLREQTLAPHSTLRTIVLEARKAFETADEVRLIEAVNACSLVLRQSGLTAKTTTDLLDQMRGYSSESNELFWAAKGCGAMGADVIVVLHSRSRADDVVAWAKGRGLDVCGGLSQLSIGLEVLQEGLV